MYVWGVAILNVVKREVKVKPYQLHKQTKNFISVSLYTFPCAVDKIIWANKHGKLKLRWIVKANNDRKYEIARGDENW